MTMGQREHEHTNDQATAHSATDPERVEAERAALDLIARTRPGLFDQEGQAAEARRLCALTDHQLRTELYLLRRRVESGESGKSGNYETPAGLTSSAGRTRETLLSRYRPYSEGARRGERAPQAGDRAPADEDLLDELAQLGITVAEDGLVEVDRVTPDVHAIVGRDPELAIAMFHHTSSALLDAIRQEGLRVGKPTNFFNTQQGVYLSTMRAGQPVSVYSARAARVHGGEPVTLRVRRKLSEIRPDPDDADLAWAQGRQYITAAVPPADIMWEAPEPGASAVPAHENQADVASRRTRRPR